MQNTFSESGNDSKWFLKNHFSDYVCWTRDPSPFIEKVIFNFHFDYLTISNARPHEISIPIQYWKLSTPAPARKKTHYAHCRFWSILAQMSIGFCDGKFFLTKSWNLQELIINTRGTFEPKSPKVLQKYDLGGAKISQIFCLPIFIDRVMKPLGKIFRMKNI